MTSDLSKTKALAICFRNLKGAKKKDLLSTARALKYLRNLPEYRSNRSVGEQVGVSAEIVRQFIALLDLPAPVRTNLRDGKLGLEQGKLLWQLHRRRPSTIEDTANAMCAMTAMESRDLVEFLIRTPDASVDDALQILEEAKTKIIQDYYVVAMLDETSYESLSSRARKEGVSVNDLVTTVIAHWLEDIGELSR